MDINRVANRVALASSSEELRLDFVRRCVEERQALPVRVVKEFDVPAMAGYSYDARTIYIDRDLDTIIGSGVDIEPYLVLHEIAEKALVDFFGMDYEDAHSWATKVERNRAEEDGIDWDEYSRIFSSQLERTKSKKNKVLPPDLDMTPYGKRP